MKHTFEYSLTTFKVLLVNNFAVNMQLCPCKLKLCIYSSVPKELKSNSCTVSYSVIIFTCLFSNEEIVT